MNVWIREHFKPLGLALASIYLALKPELFDGQVWNEKQWLAFALFVLGTWQAFSYANTTTTIARYTKEIVVVVSATIGALISVLPDVSRADFSVIIAAAAAAVWSIVAPNPTTRGVISHVTEVPHGRP